MLEVGRLVDRKRPIASWTLSGCLFAIIAVITSTLGHTWLTAEVSTVFLTVRQDVGLFSINQYTLLGGGGTRERASVTQMSLADWEHQLCDAPTSDMSSGPFPGSGWIPAMGTSSSDEGVMNKACTYVGALRSAGILSAFLTVACCVFFVLAFLDLRNAICVAEAIEPHVAPFQQLGLSDPVRRLLPASDVRVQVATAVPVELNHLGLNQNEGIGGDYEAIGDGGPDDRATRDEETNGGLRPMPTILAMRTIGTLDIGLAEHLCESGRDSLKRCSFRLWVNVVLLLVVVATWLFVFIEAQLSKQDLAQAIQGLGPGTPSLPLSIRLSYSFYYITGVTAFVLLITSLQPKLLAEDLKSLNFLAGQAP